MRVWSAIFLLCAILSASGRSQENLSNSELVRDSVQDSLYVFEQVRFADPVINDYFLDDVFPVIKGRGSYSAWEDWIYLTVRKASDGYNLQIWYCPESSSAPGRPGMKSYVVVEGGFPILVLCEPDCDLVLPVGRRIGMHKWNFPSLICSEDEEFFDLDYKSGKLILKDVDASINPVNTIPFDAHQPRERRLPRGLERYFTVPVDAAIEGLGAVSHAYHPF